MPQHNDLLALSAELEHRLITRYGVMLGSRDLWRVLGYHSQGSFRQGLLRGSLDLPVFEVEGRRGRFSLAKDVATWIARQRLGLPNIDITPGEIVPNE